MKIFRISILFFTLLLGCTTIGCKKDNPAPEPIAKADEINTFIWNGMQAYYLWVDNVANLTNPQFAKEDSLNAFLNKYTDHEKLFDALLYKNLDKWSWIVDDYVALEKQFQGIYKSMGHDFTLARVSSTSNNIVGIVRYVVKGSPADIAGIKRGEIFSTIDNQQLTISNYQTLLSKESYKISFADNNTLALNGKSATLTAIELHENPIYLDTVYVVNNQKVGYLIYNSFISDYDIQLNNVFKKFKDAGVQKLVLDLRYNSGGQETSMVHLASMIYSTDKTKIFFKRQYNKLLGEYIVNEDGAESLNTRLTNVIEKTDITPETPINSLGLNKLIVITTENTASASEVLIHGLRPYISVTTIGTTTAGKYVGSMTVYDWIAKNTKNPNHKWALQPIIVKTTNSAGDPDYVNGLAPSVKLEENYQNLTAFGIITEPLLQSAINSALLQPQSLTKSKSNLTKVADSKDFRPHSKEMIMNGPTFK